MKSPSDKHEEPRGYGLLTLLDPNYAHLLSDEDRFTRLVDRAADQGKLWFPEVWSLH
jgi:hypothetical protein